uniref:Pre-mRNA-splicing factor Syf1-like N-terminal HAT-repeats domain-containing protein n=1 Tax=Timema poppense TaxID=170557 RepID=A0A7R9CJS2_TIMPO|nr:unnamed protein product [Timema poppensis]
MSTLDTDNRDGESKPDRASASDFTGVIVEDVLSGSEVEMIESSSDGGSGGGSKNEDDLPYEEEILRNPFSVKHWLRYIEHKKGSSRQTVNIIYERALKELPGSYKLWYNYLKLRRRQVKGRCITDPSYQDINNTFERSLVFMHKVQA